MKKRILACLLLVSMGLQPVTSVLAIETESSSAFSEEKATEETLERPLDTLTQELLEENSEPVETAVTDSELPTEVTDESEAPLDLEPSPPTPETLSAPRAVTTMPWGQTVCTIENNSFNGYTITVKAGSGTIAGTPDQTPWKDYPYRSAKTIVFDDSGGKIQLVGDQSELFYYCQQLETVGFSGVDTSQVTNMSRMFVGCIKLSSLDLSNFDTSHVTNMYQMFYLCRNLSSLDVSGFDKSQVTDMSEMFNDCRSLSSLDLSNFDTSQVTDMSKMFNGCRSLSSLDLSGFDTSQVTDMNYMFYNCSSLGTLDVSGFDTSQVTDMYGMFSYCQNLSSLDLSNFDTSQVTNMGNMFNDCRSLSSLDLSNFDTSQVTLMSYMFYGCSNLSSLDVSSFDTSQVTNMSGMYSNCSKLQSLKLGSQTKLSTDCMLSEVTADENYTGKWTTVGGGTVERPKGDWSGTVSELYARSQTGVADTYVWEPKTYTITFNVNGGSNTPTEITNVYKNDVIDLSTVVAPTPPSSSYEFIGWTTVIDDSTTLVESLTMPANDVTLYANWKVLMEISSIPVNFIFKNNVRRDEYRSQIVTLNSKAHSAKGAFATKWKGTLDWKLTVTMAEWRNPDDATDALTGVQMMMDNQLTKQDGTPAPATIHSESHVILNAGETKTLVTTTAGNSSDGTGDWQSTIDFDSVKLKIPRWGGRDGSYYTSQLTWSLDDTI